MDVTYPCLGAGGLELRDLLCALLPRLLVVFVRVEDIVLVQAGEEPVAAFPAAGAT